MFFESLHLIIVRSYVMSLDSGKTNQRSGRKKRCEIRSSNNDVRRGEVTSANFDARLQKIITIRPSTVSILTSRHGRLGLYFYLFKCAPKKYHIQSVRFHSHRFFMRGDFGTLCTITKCLFTQRSLITNMGG
jgi:hypothetical protein